MRLEAGDLMRIFEYHVLYKNQQEFVKKFEPEHFEEARTSGFPGISQVDVECGMPQMAALFLVNKWNRQNVDSGFVYWLD